MATGGGSTDPALSVIVSDGAYQKILKSVGPGQLFVVFYIQQNCSHCITMEATVKIMIPKFPQVLFACVDGMKCMK